MKRGRKAKLGAEEKEAMESYIEEHPTSLRSELVDFLRNKFNVKVSIETVGRTLKELKLSRK
jgi:transposase